MTFCSSSKVAVFSLLTIDVDLCLNMSEDLNQIYCRRSLDMNTNITSQEAIALLKSAGSQAMGGTIGGINGITTAWGKAQAAANAYAKAAIADRAVEKTYEAGMAGSTSTGQSKSGVTVVGKGQSIKSTNNVTVNNNNTYNQPTASDKKGQLAIIGRG
jgi:hypothetical protein